METLERKEAASAALTERSYAQIFGNKTKQAVLDFLSANAKKGYSVLDMHNTLSIPESTLSINLTELSRLGIVTFQKEGKYKYYRLAQRCVPVFRSVFHSLNQAVSCMDPRGGIRRTVGVKNE